MVNSHVRVLPIRGVDTFLIMLQTMHWQCAQGLQQPVVQSAYRDSTLQPLTLVQCAGGSDADEIAAASESVDAAAAADEAAANEGSHPGFLSRNR